jgi:hypothetical protein
LNNTLCISLSATITILKVINWLKKLFITLLFTLPSEIVKTVNSMESKMKQPEASKDRVDILFEELFLR